MKNDLLLHIHRMLRSDNCLSSCRRVYHQMPQNHYNNIYHSYLIHRDSLIPCQPNTLKKDTFPSSPVSSLPGILYQFFLFLGHLTVLPMYHIHIRISIRYIWQFHLNIQQHILNNCRSHPSR